jgi:predicted CXXCH cytochrome family protein
MDATIAGQLRGTESCAASGCHGKAFDGNRDWSSAHSRWFSGDPHRRACDVLYTQRSVEIYRNLHPTEQLAEAVDAGVYETFLQRRCVGCHASSTSDAKSPLAMQSGVSCESCHGPASGWIDQHYLTSWKGGGGFRDLKDLPTRAAVCAACHVGPIVADDGTRYDVDHELIAAGHPRLAFELDAYLTNYPKHWNEATDHVRYPGTFHANAWLCGQQAASSKLIEQLARRQQTRPEFSNYDCFDCHHSLRVRGDARTGFPRPALLPLAQFAAVMEDRAELPLPALWRQAESHLTQQWTEAELARFTFSDIEFPDLTLLHKAELLSHATALRRIPVAWGAAGTRTPTWDEAVQFYLAVQAFSRDLEPSARNQLASAAEQLATALGPQNFAGRLPTQYESPTTFDPRTLASPLVEIDHALATIANQTTTAP